MPASTSLCNRALGVESSGWTTVAMVDSLSEPLAPKHLRRLWGGVGRRAAQDCELPVRTSWRTTAVSKTGRWHCAWNLALAHVLALTDNAMQMQRTELR